MKSNYVKVSCTGDLAIMEWFGTIDTIDYRLAHQEFITTFSRNKCKLWLLNYKGSEAIELQNHEWTLEKWLPEAMKVVEAGLEKIAIVVPENIFNRVSVRVMATQIAKQKYDLDLAFFDQEIEAKEWLTPEKYAIK